MDDVHDLIGDLDFEIPAPPGGLAGGGDGAGGDDARGGHFFGPYQLIQEVGAGGVARVLRARHIHPRFADQRFAVKVLHDELSRDPKVVSLFRHEAYVLSLLKHPNIVQTFEAGSQEQQLFIAMEYVDGRDLDNMLVRCHRHRIPIPIPVAVHVANEVLKALTYAHELRGHGGTSLHLVHRDVNPANVFLSYDGRVKLGDFGVAEITAGRLEKSRETAGKVGYFSPEQLSGGAVDHRSDLFALGVMLFEMLCGTRLFGSDDADKAMRLNRRAKIPRITKLNRDIPEDLERVVLGALERKPDHRYASGREMLTAIQDYVPESGPMALAVAALVRKVFVREHIQELQLDEGLAGMGPARGHGQIVEVLSGDPRARLAFNELLLSRGYRVRESSAGASAASQAEDPPQIVLCDVCSNGFSPAAFQEWIRQFPERPPVVAVCEGLDLRWLHLADAVHAVDVLFKPFNIERVLTSVRAAISGAARVARSSDVALEAAELVLINRVLFLSRDPRLVAAMSSGLSERGFEVDVAATIPEALARTATTSYHAVIFDAHPATSGDRLFAGQYRCRPGMGLVPFVYLVDENRRADLHDMASDRSAVEVRTLPVHMLVDVILRLRSDGNAGRCFVRYRARLEVELRYGGRVFSGHCIDISRGGLMLRCSQMPPVGTAVGLSIKLPGATVPVSATGRVVRVDRPGDGEVAESAGLGISFRSFAGNGESQLIDYIASIDQRSLRSPTVILSKPPFEMK